MRDPDQLLVKEFADMAGVTVRALQFYDREGLLTPERSASGYRLYHRDDLLRLQQILTLKTLGFSLDEIRAALAGPDYDVRSALQFQKEALDARVAQLQQVSAALSQAITLLEREPGGDWSLATDILHLLAEGQKLSRVRDHYTPEQQARLEDRAQHITPRQLLDWHQAWSNLNDGFQALLDQGRPPDDPDAQRLAAQMNDLVQGFTEGDAGMEQSLRATWTDIRALPADQQPMDPTLFEYTCQALEVYRQNHDRHVERSEASPDLAGRDSSLRSE